MKNLNVLFISSEILMFVAIVVPPMKKSKPTVLCVIIAKPLGTSFKTYLNKQLNKTAIITIGIKNNIFF